MTPGPDAESADGKIERIIDALRHERYRFRSATRVYIQRRTGSSALTSLRAHGADSAFTARALEAYGGVDEQELVPFAEAHDLYGELWRR